METHLPRSEIVRLVRAILGIQTSSALAAMVEEQHVAAVQAAALKVSQDCRWVNAQRRVTVSIGIAQYLVNYPQDCGPGSVLGVAVYDTDRYIPLAQAIIPISLDVDQAVIAGGATLEAILDRPRAFQQLEQITLWPPARQAYPLRIEYMHPMGLPLATSISVVDAQLIQFWAASMISAQMGDTERQRYYATLYADRFGSLRAWQAAGTAFALDSEADLAEDEIPLTSGDWPNWDRRATPYPPA